MSLFLPFFHHLSSMSFSEKPSTDKREHQAVGHSSSSMTDVERGYARLHPTSSADSLELDDLPPRSASSTSSNAHVIANDDTERQPSKQSSMYAEIRKREKVFLDRLRGKGRRVPSWAQSGKNVLTYSCKSFHLVFHCSSLNGA